MGFLQDLLGGLNQVENSVGDAGAKVGHGIRGLLGRNPRAAAPQKGLPIPALELRATPINPNMAKSRPMQFNPQVQGSAPMQGLSAFGHTRDMARFSQPQGRNPQRQGFAPLQVQSMGIPYSANLGDFGDDEGTPIQGGYFDEQNINQMPTKFNPFYNRNF